ncbi:MgtC/SapB family protein [Streptomyces sp. NPDC049915]|uniref:MgtC/SapB family protein n=1 Tax=Streptomyces sp. NPDC049915 TaxID=3155510 RepID=UPI003420CFAF
MGLGAALFMLVSKYGFADMLGRPGVALDPSRVAAQIVSGIGFIGGGLIFVRRDAVRGLTTAASGWLAASIGAAAGAGLLVLACGGDGGVSGGGVRLPGSGRVAAAVAGGDGAAAHQLSRWARTAARHRQRVHRGGLPMAGLRTAGSLPTQVAPTEVGVLLELSGSGTREELGPRLTNPRGHHRGDVPGGRDGMKTRRGCAARPRPGWRPLQERPARRTTRRIRR